MKGVEIFMAGRLPACGRGRSLITRTAWPDVTRDLAVRHDLVAGLHIALDGVIDAVVVQHFDGSGIGLAVLAHHQHEIAFRPQIDGIARHHGGARNLIDGDGDRHGLSRHQPHVAVGKVGPKLDGAGRGADGIADEIDRRFLGSALRARNRHRRHQPVLVELVLDLRQPVLRQHERNLDGLDLGDADQGLGGGAGGGDHIARLDQDGAGLAVDRRHDVREIQIDAGGLDSRLVGFHHALVRFDLGGLGRELLVGDGVLLRQGLIALQVDPVIGQGCGVARQLAFGLRLDRLIGGRIDLEEKLAFVDDVAFVEIGRQQLARHLGRDLHGGRRHHRADGLLGDGHVAALGHSDLHRRRRRGFALGREQGTQEMPGQQQQGQDAQAVKDNAAVAPQPLQPASHFLRSRIRDAESFV